MPINTRTITVQRVLASALLAAVLAGCSTMGASFGGRQGDLVDVPGVEFYASDQAISEAKAHFRRGNYGHSATLYKRAFELNPKDAEALNGLAASYDRLRRFDLADRAYQQLYKLTGGTATYYNNVGYSYLLRGNLISARTNFLKAYELDPDNATVANNLQLLGASYSVAQR